ncbi:MAG: hypothetical protein PHF20_06205 [Halothiobacillaceae bacterium]|nr:hypothetical protein [Halothiobacillaceae bacterium]
MAATVVANVGITAAAGISAADVSAAEAYIAGLITAAPGAEGAAVAAGLDAFSKLTGDATYGAAATAWNTTIANAMAYTASGATADVAINTSGATVALTTGVDKMMGTAGNDTFNAFIADNSNTLNSGDVIDGGAGTDTVYADIGNAQAFAITPHLSNVETVAIRAQSDDTDAAQNNVNGQGGVHIDAQRTAGVTNWTNDNSRADLFIEDVTILPTQITKDITITFANSDPGNVDYAVYFDQNSLRNATASNSYLNLQVMDTASVVAGTAPLLNSPYGGFVFSANGTQITLQSAAIDAAQTYAELLTAFQAAIAANPATNGIVTAQLGSSFTVTDTTTGTAVTGTEIQLVASGSVAITTPAGSGWIASGVVPANSGLHTNFNTASTSNTALVTSTVVLDNVGSGSTGGDLVIGGMSTGTDSAGGTSTSSSKGVQRFEITVNDNSKLQSINSTNNTLQEVTIVNGAQDIATDAYVAAGGNLTVNGKVAVANEKGATDIIGAQPQQNGGKGFSDVRVIDGSAMTGKLAFTAEVTNASIAKYLNLADTASSPTADNIAFVYTGGGNNDTMDVVIDNNVAASKSNSTLSGQSDFTFAIDGGAGDDSITTNIGGGEGTAWLADQQSLNNITVTGGAGNDTITTTGAGNVTISAGAGNDTVYADNSGTVDTVWTVNNKVGATLDNMETNGGFSGFLYKGKLTVTLAGAGGTGTGGAVTSGAAAANTNGFEVTVDIPTDTNYAVTQYHVNQAIKAAINNDAVLSKLLSATDGPADTLKITSLIDGAFNANDLKMTVAGGTVTATDTAVITAYKTYAKDSTKVFGDVNTATTAAVTAANGVLGMETAGAVIGGTVTGALTTETATFTPVAMVAGETVIINGLTVSATGAVTAAEVVTALEGGAAPANGSIAGANNAAAWTITVDAGATVVYTSATANTNVADLTDTGTAKAANGAAVLAATTVQGGAATAATPVTGTISSADSDNVINMGAGSDVVVLGTGATSQETLAFSGTGIDTTVVNFDATAGVRGDKLDFTSYLVDIKSASGSTESQQRIATTIDLNTAATTQNQVKVLNGATFTATDTFAGLTAAKLLTAVNTTGNAAYAGLVDGTLTATFNLASTALVGGTAHAVVMVENSGNKGEYAMFELSWLATTAGNADFDAATLIGVVDFGNSITAATLVA